LIKKEAENGLDQEEELVEDKLEEVVTEMDQEVSLEVQVEDIEDNVFPMVPAGFKLNETILCKEDLLNKK